MAKSRKKPAAAAWNNSLDEDAVREAFAEATVDAFGDSEQHVGLFHTIEQELEFPFPGRVIGENVSVVGVEWPDKHEFGIDLICERKGEQHRVEACSVELLEPLPEGHLFLAAYLQWRRFV